MTSPSQEPSYTRVDRERRSASLCGSPKLGVPLWRTRSRQPGINDSAPLQGEEEESVYADSVYVLVYHGTGTRAPIPRFEYR